MLYPKKFSTSEELFTWLRSTEGGNLFVRDEETSPYAVIYYKKKMSNMKLDHVLGSRSVVWDKAANKSVFVAPAHGKTLTGDVGEFVAEEFVDGVMVNMFYSPALSSWLLATRTQLGATNHFYGNRPFSELFWETFKAVGLTQEDLSTDATYSWVLQHPEERVVVAPPYGIPRLSLVQVSGTVSEKLAALHPTRYTLATLKNVKEFVTAEGKKRGAQWQGVVLKTPAGERYRLRSTEYNEARQLRGNQAKRPFLWLERWSAGRLIAYLRLFPEEQCDADVVVNRFKACTQELHELYMKVYRKKELPLGQAPQKYRKLLWDAHKAGKGAYFPELRKFMNEQDTARKLWLVNYEVRYATAPAPAPAPAPAAVDDNAVDATPAAAVDDSLSATSDDNALSTAPVADTVDATPAADDSL